MAIDTVASQRHPRTPRRYAAQRVKDSPITERRLREWDCVVSASMALTWGGYARAFADEQIVNEVAAESENVKEFREGIDRAQSKLLKGVKDQMSDAFPRLKDLYEFRRICPSGAEELGWINTETGEHTYNEEALNRLPDIITEVVKKHETIHEQQVAENGEPGSSVFAHADVEAEAYQDSLSRIVAWLQNSCEPGFVPDGLPWLQIPFQPFGPGD